MIEIRMNTVVLLKLQDSGIMMEVERHDIVSKMMLEFIKRIKRVEEAETSECVAKVYERGFTAGKESVKQHIVERVDTFIKGVKTI